MEIGFIFLIIYFIVLLIFMSIVTFQFKFLFFHKVYCYIFDRKTYKAFNDIMSGNHKVVCCILSDYCQAKLNDDLKSFIEPVYDKTSIVYDKDTYYIITDSNYSVLLNDNWVINDFDKPFIKELKSRYEE